MSKQKTIQVSYQADKQLSFSVDEDFLLKVVEPQAVESVLIDQNSLVTEELLAFLQLPGSLLVIVNDGTRPTPTRIILHALKKLLLEAEAEFIIATGVHRAPTMAEYRYIFGDAYECFAPRIHVHDARLASEMVLLGVTSRGTEFTLNRKVVEAGKILVIGSVEPHYFAGYTGGRKAFLPGTAGYGCIEQNHALALSEAAEALMLAGNPVHEDMVEAVKFIDNPVYSIMTVLTKEHEIAGVFSGTLEQAFSAAVKKADEMFVVEIPHKADVVVTVAKYPMDVDLYQAQKAIDNAKLALKKGGVMLVVASCREGLGEPAFAQLLKNSKSPQAALETIRKGYALGYHKAAKLAQVFMDAKVSILCDLPDEEVSSIFLTPFANLQSAVDEALSQCSKREGRASLLVLLDGSVTVVRVTDVEK